MTKWKAILKNKETETEYKRVLKAPSRQAVIDRLIDDGSLVNNKLLRVERK